MITNPYSNNNYKMSVRCLLNTNRYRSFTCWFVDDSVAHGHVGTEGQALDGMLQQQRLDESNDRTCKTIIN